ncbi:MAG: hypothetical protein C5B49_05305 [Bdellovibrio sp.]|nr:MAG: hypothetical protein C5B49_05305 [Bdellovibrio sp.]
MVEFFELHSNFHCFYPFQFIQMQGKAGSGELGLTLKSEKLRLNSAFTLVSSPADFCSFFLICVNLFREVRSFLVYKQSKKFRGGGHVEALIG